MKITLKEISQRTGLSVTVLSRVISGNGYVSDDKRKQALKAFAEYGYKRAQPHAADSAPTEDLIIIITGRTGNTYEDVISQITLCAHKSSKKVLTAYSNYDGVFEEEYLRYALRLNVFGIVMLSVPDFHTIANVMRECPIPIVTIGRYSSMIPTDTITQDSYEMGVLAAQKLMAAGHTRLGYLGGHVESSITRDKELGFTDCLRAAGLTLPKEWIDYGKLTYESGVKYAEKLLTSNDVPTALFVSNDQMAMGIIDRLTQAGCRIPQDLSLICSDKTLASDTFFLPPDRLYIDWGETASTALRLLIARRDDASRPRRNVTFPTRYAPGQTICPPRSTPSLKTSNA